MSGRAGPAVAMEMEIPELFTRFGLTVEAEIWGPTWVLFRDAPMGTFETDWQAIQLAWRIAAGIASRRRGRGRPQLRDPEW